MFNSTKTIACVEFSKTSIFCALAQITGRKVDIVAIDQIHVESGILEEGVVYDVPHLQQLVKNLITSVSRNQNKIDAAWIAVPDNKIRITKFEVHKNGKTIDEYELHKAIEEKFNYSAAKLYLINRPIHELNGRVYYLADAIRSEHLKPFIEVFEPLGIPVESIFPTFQCVYEELKEHFRVPTLLLHPYGKGYKFFLADSNGVHLESVWGHNVIEFNDNLDKAIEEILQYAKQSKEVAIGVKRVMAIESPNLDSELLQIYLRRAGVEFSWIPYSNNGDGFDPVSIITLKGIIKNAMNPGFSRGFLEPQVTHEDDYVPESFANARNAISVPQKDETFGGYRSNYVTPSTKNTVTKNYTDTEEKWNFKVLIATIILAVALVGSLAYAGWRISERLSESKSDETAESTPTPTATPFVPTATSTPTPTDTPSPTPTATPSVTVTPVDFTKSEVKVLVLNGNTVAGEAKRITGVLSSNGFVTKTPGNNATKVPTTSVTYKDPRAAKLAQEIVTLIEPSYASAKATLDAAQTEDILVVLGSK